MNAIGTELKDAYILTTNIYEDNRGSFTESFNLRDVQKIIGDYEFVQDCHSVSAKNVVRGLHYQVERPQGKIVRCLFGEIYDVIVDLRQNSETFGKWIGVRLSAGTQIKFGFPLDLLTDSLFYLTAQKFFIKLLIIDIKNMKELCCGMMKS